MNQKYFIALLPNFSNDFYKKIESLHFLQCYPEIRLPFHTTLFFLGDLSLNNKKRVLNWLIKKNNCEKITAKIKKINSFRKNEKDFVYFLELNSEKIIKIHNELKRFSDIHKDSFDFTPHLSLFFPQKQLNKKDFLILQGLFKINSVIEFNGLFLGSVVNNVTHIHKYIPLIWTN